MEVRNGDLGFSFRGVLFAGLVLGMLGSMNAFPRTSERANDDSARAVARTTATGSTDAARTDPGPAISVRPIRTGPLRDVPPIPSSAALRLDPPELDRASPPADPSSPRAVYGPVAVAPGRLAFRPEGDLDDVNGHAGETQYVQWNGTAFAVFDKTTGALLYGPAAGSTLFGSLGGLCENGTDGDPAVVHDNVVGRWILSRFVSGATPNDAHLCVAVSLTEDATGEYDLYDLLVDSTRVGDRPKLGVRPDGDSVTLSVTAAGVASPSPSQTYVVERTPKIQDVTARLPTTSLSTLPAAPKQCTPGGCDDNDPCTVDTCDPVLGCIYTPVNCDDGNACTVDSCSPAGGQGVATLFIGHDISQLEREYQKIGTFVQTWGAIGQATGAAVDANGVVYICNPAYGNNVIERRGPGNTNLGAITATVNGQWIEDLGNFGGGFILAGTIEGDIYRINTATGAHILQFSTGQSFIGVAYDGTDIWTTGGYTNTLVARRDLSGNVLSTFNTGQTNAGIGYDPDDGTLWIGHANGQVTRWTQSGMLLGGFATAAGGQFVDGVELAKMPLPPGCQNNAIDCNDNLPCTLDACDPMTGCFYTPNPCDDGNPCTDDACHPQNGCVSTNNSASCDDSDLCTTGETCSGGLCQGGVPVACDDNNVCTTDSCDPRFGCAFVDNNALCDDGNACTFEETCLNGTCQAGFPVVCDDSNPCTTDSCIPAMGCVYTDQPNGSACDDGDACTTGEVCVGGVCQLGIGIACTPSDPCHVAGTCDPLTGLCSNPTAPNGTPCDDGNPCTAGDHCIDGVCGATVIVTPAETQNLTVAADKATYSWSPASDATAYDSARGDTRAFPVGSSSAGEVCFGDLTEASLVDATSPAPGTGYWYLARARNPCGTGPWGAQSNGTARITTTCP